jgi:hypothetical protein
MEWFSGEVKPKRGCFTEPVLGGSDRKCIIIPEALCIGVLFL